MQNPTLRSRPRNLALTSSLAFALFAAFVSTTPLDLARAQVAPSLGTAQKFVVLGGSTVTNTGSTVLHGDLGVNPGNAITGFPPGTVSRGVTHEADATASQAQTDAAAAYAGLRQACKTTYTVPTDIGGLVLAPGVYCFSSSAGLTGTLTLDAAGDPNAVWVFAIASTLITASNSSVQLVNSAQQQNVFWQVGSSATLGTGSTFTGNVLAMTSITMNTDAILLGRAIALKGAVTLDANKVSDCVCIEPYDAIASKIRKTITVAPAVQSVSGTVFGATTSPDGKSVWVAGYNGISEPGFVSLIDVASLTVGNSALVGAGPADIAFSSAGSRAFITNYYGSSLSVLSVPALGTLQTIDLSDIPLTDPFGLVYTASSLLITTQGNDNLAPIFHDKPLTFSTTSSIPGQSGRPAVMPADAPFYAGKVLVPVFSNGHPELRIIGSSSGNTDAYLTLASSGAAPKAVVVSPDGKYAYVSLFDSSGGAGGVWVISIQPELTTKTVILTCDPDNYGEAISKDGNYLLVAGFSEKQVALIDTTTDTVDAIIGVGLQPNAIALASGDSEAFVTNQGDGTVMVITFGPNL